MKTYKIISVLCIVTVIIVLSVLFAMTLLSVKTYDSEFKSLFSETKCIDISNGKREIYITQKADGIQKENVCEDFINFMQSEGWDFTDQHGASLYFTKGNETVIYDSELRKTYMVFEKYK